MMMMMMVMSALPHSALLLMRVRSSWPLRAVVSGNAIRTNPKQRRNL